MKIKPSWDRPIKARFTRKFAKECENLWVRTGIYARAEARAHAQAKRKEYIKSRKK